MELSTMICDVADVLKIFDSEKPIHKNFNLGIGPFGEPQQAIFIIAYEHTVHQIDLNVLIASFEIITRKVIGVNIGARIEEQRGNLVHPEHQVVRCLARELI